MSARHLVHRLLPALALSALLAHASGTEPVDVAPRPSLPAIPPPAVTPDIFHVDGDSGDDAADGLTAGTAVRTLERGWTLASEANDAKGIDDNGRALGASLLSLAPSDGPYALRWKPRLSGEILLDGQGAAKVSADGVRLGYRDNSLSTEPPESILRLRDVDWTGSGAFQLGLIQTGSAPRPVFSLFSVEGGRFVWKDGASDFNLAFTYADKNYTNPVTAAVVFDGKTAAPSLETGTFRCALHNNQPAGHMVGLFDGRAATGGSIDSHQSLQVGFYGAPAIGNVLLGTNWTLRLRGGNLQIGRGDGGCSSTGIVSLAEGGSLDINAATISLAESRGGKALLDGRLIGRRLAHARISADLLLLGFMLGDGGDGYGLIDLSETDGGTFASGGESWIGALSKCDAAIRLGRDWDVSFGKKGKKIPYLVLGYKSNAGLAKGAFSMESGLFRAYVNRFHLATDGKFGRGIVRLGTSDVVLDCASVALSCGNDLLQGYSEIDASASTNIQLAIDGLGIAYVEGTNAAYGRMALGRGRGTVKNLDLGNRGTFLPEVRGGLLELDGFEMKVTGRLFLRPSSRIRVLVDGYSGGLDIAGNVSLNQIDGRPEGEEAAVAVAFKALPANCCAVELGSHDSICWGLRLAGDRLQELEGLLADGKVTFDTSALPPETALAVKAFYDPATDATYLGVPVRYMVEKTLEVRASSAGERYEGDFVPPLGVTEGLLEGNEITCSVTQASFQGNLFVPAGYVLERYGTDGWGAPVTNLGASSLSYRHGPSAGRLTWLWQRAAFRCEIAGVDGKGTISLSPAADSEGYYTLGTKVTVTATPSQELPRTRFIRWEGDVPAGKETENPLEVTMDRSRRLRPVFEVIPEEFYVDGETGDDASSGASPAEPFRTLAKGLDEARASNLASRFEEGKCLGHAVVHLAEAAEPYPVNLDNRPFEGSTVLQGAGPLAKAQPYGRLEVAHDDRSSVSSLRLLDVALEATPSFLHVGHRESSIPDAIRGEVSTEGGSFSLLCGNSAYIGADTTHDHGKPVTGILRLDGDTKPVALSMSDLRCGLAERNTPVEGLVDGRAVTDGSLEVRGNLRVGFNGDPGIGNLLLGTNWTLSVDGGVCEIGCGAGGWATTGTVSFAQGGSLAVKVRQFSLGDCHDVSAKNTGVLVGRELNHGSITSEVFLVGFGPSNEGSSSGLLDLSTTDGGSLSCSGETWIGSRGGGTSGKVLLGEDWDAVFGVGTGSPKYFYLSARAGRGFAESLFSMKSGRFKAVVSEFRIADEAADSKGRLELGRSDVWIESSFVNIGHGGDRRHGVLDGSASTNVTLSAECLRVGFGDNCENLYGLCSLGCGTGCVQRLYLGSRGPLAEDLNAGLLELKGFRLEVGREVDILRSGSARIVIDGKPASLDLSAETVLMLPADRGGAAGPAISIVFQSLPERVKWAPKGAHDSIHYGLKWAGNHLAELEPMVADGRVAVSTPGLSPRAAEAVGLFYDEETDATYVGLYTRQAKPGTLLVVR